MKKTTKKKCSILEALKIAWDEPAWGNESKDYIKKYCLTCPLDPCIYDTHKQRDINAELEEIVLDLSGRASLDDEEAERLQKAQELREVMIENKSS